MKCSLIPLVGIKGQGELQGLKEIWGLHVNVIYMEEQTWGVEATALAVAGSILDLG